MSDRRLTPVNARVAHLSMKGRVTGKEFVSGEWARISAPIADLLSAPEGRRERQVLMGERFLVLERRDGFGFVQAEKDGYCGYLPLTTLGDDRMATHWVAAPATHLYAGPDIKERDHAALSQGARLTIAAEHARFFETDGGMFVPRRHLRPVGDWLDDPALVAESYLGTPYLWGGNSRTGIDCSGLVQGALLACGLPCPGDSDLQLAQLGRELPPGSACRRGDLLFWQGHVAMAVDARRMIHANAFNMAVTYEDIDAATARIVAQGEGPVLAVKRL